MMRLFRLSTQVYLERFDAEALLLVADRNRLLTVNAAAAELFAAATQGFDSRSFTLEQAVAGLREIYQLSAADSLAKARELLAFGLRHGLVCRAGTES